MKRERDREMRFGGYFGFWFLGMTEDKQTSSSNLYTTWRWRRLAGLAGGEVGWVLLSFFISWCELPRRFSFSQQNIYYSKYGTKEITKCTDTDKQTPPPLHPLPVSLPPIIFFFFRKIPTNNTCNNNYYLHVQALVKNTKSFNFKYTS